MSSLALKYKKPERWVMGDEGKGRRFRLKRKSNLEWRCWQRKRKKQLRMRVLLTLRGNCGRNQQETPSPFLRQE
jgi:hypothetical protein